MRTERTVLHLFLGASLLLPAWALSGCDGDDDPDAGVDSGTTPETDSGTTDMDGGGGDDDAGGGDDDAGGGDDDAGGGDDDAGGGDDGGEVGDAGPLDPTSMQIQAVRDAAPGTVNLPIEGATVTYRKGVFGTDVAGFFLQAAPTGPALFVAVDPFTHSPEIIPGQVIDVTIVETEENQGRLEATMISDVTVDSSGADLTVFEQDVSSVNLASETELDAREAELVTVTATIATVFESCSTGFSCAQITTAGVPAASAELRFRVTNLVIDALDLRSGCVVEIGPSPLWRFTDTAQPSAWRMEDVSVTSCPSAAAPAAAGDLIITEVALDLPAGDPDTSFVELYNPSETDSLDLMGCTYTDSDAGTPTTIDSSLIVLPGQRLVLAAAGADVSTSAAALAVTLDDEDSFSISCGGTVIDAVDWGASGFPTGAAGSTLQVDPAALLEADPSVANDSGDRWCLAPETASYGTMGFHGTPGGANFDCPFVCTTIADRLVINEVDYDNIGGDIHEFIEIFNPPGSGVTSLDGYFVVLFNQTGTEYDRVALSGAIAEGDFVVIAPTASSVSRDFTIDPPQQGPDDSIGLLQGTTVIDFVVYDGMAPSDTLTLMGGGTTTIPSGMNVSIGEDMTAPTGTPPAEDLAGLARVADGCDSASPAMDWGFVMTTTPGTTNTP